MKSPAELITREPRDHERDIVNDVLAIAVEWSRGDLPLDEVRKLTNGRDRFLAISCAKPGSPEKLALLALLDHLIATEQPMKVVHSTRDDATFVNDRLINISAGKPDQPAIYVTDRELGEMGFVKMTNWRGQRVYVSPMHYINEQPIYPRVDLEPGDHRRSIEAKMKTAYTTYRKDKRRSRRGHDDQ